MGESWQPELNVCMGKQQPWRGLRATSREDTGWMQYPVLHSLTNLLHHQENRNTPGSSFFPSTTPPCESTIILQAGPAQGGLAHMSVCVSVKPCAGLDACVDGGAADCGSSFVTHLSWGAPLWRRGQDAQPWCVSPVSTCTHHDRWHCVS